MSESTPLSPSRSTASLVESVARTISKNYGPAPIVMDHGDGVWLVDRDGKKYLDFVAGIAVCCLGHAHPALVAALQDQASKLLHVSNMFINEPQALLQERIVELSFADRVFFCNSGAEANEAAMKLARRYQKAVRGADDRVEIIAAEKSFHGRTLAAITATGQPKYWAGFEPLPGGYRHVPFNDIAALEAAVGEKTCAILLEPVQGEGGVQPATREYLEAARRLCDETGAALIFDEVQCGVGRLGHLWAYESFGVVPDIVTWAKGIGGGVPLGVMASSEKFAAGFQKGSHASTFGGNPLVCRAGLTVLEHVADEAFLTSVREVGEYFVGKLRALAADYDAAVDVRGRGLMIGVEVGTEHSGPLMLAARDEGLLINTAGGIALRFVPPLTITRADVDEAMTRLRRAFARVLG